MNISRRPRVVALTALTLVMAWVSTAPTPAAADPNEAPADSATVLGATSITGGYFHTCAILTSGGLKCWGSNGKGEIGINTISGSERVPVDVTGLSSGVAVVSGGLSVTCAVLTTGGAKCWGDNSNGMLGDNTLIDKKVPTDVSGLTSGVKTIAVGKYHTCALLDSGGVKCWGDNQFGQLGDNTLVDKKVPTDVSGLTSGVKALAVGGNHSCVLLNSGGVKCWGDGVYGQLGDNTQNTRKVPTAVSGLSSGVKAVSAGDSHTCAILDSGALKCWGYESKGALGNGTSSGLSLTPVDVTGLSSGVLGISAGGNSFTCATVSPGAAQCWGWNRFGAVGDNTQVDKDVPTQVDGLSSGVVAVTTGVEHACALLDSGAVTCWGLNSSGQLGINNTTNALVPTGVSGMTSGVGLTTTTSSTTTIATTTTTIAGGPPTTTARATTTTKPPTTTTPGGSTSEGDGDGSVVSEAGSGDLSSSGSRSGPLAAFSLALAVAGVLVIAARRRMNS